MTALKKHQDPTGAWHQVIDHEESYREFTSTCMITFAIVRGLRRGWLDRRVATRGGPRVDSHPIPHRLQRPSRRCLHRHRQNEIPARLPRPHRHPRPRRPRRRHGPPRHHRDRLLGKRESRAVVLGERFRVLLVCAVSSVITTWSNSPDEDSDHVEGGYGSPWREASGEK
jgi:hypothetical protein